MSSRIRRALLSILILLVSLTLLPSRARADSLLVSSTFSFGAAESGSFSFTWDSSSNLILPATIESFFSGTLGVFSLVDYRTTSAGHSDFPYPSLTWADEHFDTIQLALFDHFGAGFPRLGSYSLGNVELWVNRTNSDWMNLSVYSLGASSGSLIVSPLPLPISTPEPSTLLLTLLGIPLLFGAYVFWKIPHGSLGYFHATSVPSVRLLESISQLSGRQEVEGYSYAAIKEGKF